MNNNIFRLVYTLSLLVLLGGCNQPASTSETTEKVAATSQTNEAIESLTYPSARKSAQVDTFHGTEVADPYRWLEEIDSEETRQWIDAEVALSNNFLAKLPGKEGISNRLTELWNYARYSVPSKEGDHYFYYYNSGLANQSTLYVTDSVTKDGKILLDPNTLSEDGTVALSGTAISDDGKYIAYGLAEAGSDWNTWHVREIATGNDLSDEVNWVKFSGASWMKDSSGFFYSRYDEPTGEDKLKAVNYFQKLYFHKLGTDQSQDVLVYERQDEKEWGFSGEVTSDGNFLIISTWRGTEDRNLLAIKKLPLDDSPAIEIVSEWESSYSVQGFDGTSLYVITDLDAPRYRLVAIDPQNPQKEKWKEIIPQQAGTLTGVSIINQQLIASFLTDAHSKVVRYALDGQEIGELELPGIGRSAGFTGKTSDTKTYYSYQSYNRPSTVYELDLNTGVSTVIRSPELKFNPDEYMTEQQFFTSKDGTQVPMFISYRKGLEKNGDNPVLLYGYGGFNISLKPGFSVSRLTWMEMGGIYAVANLRGGGEYGREWHEGGMKLNKQNVFDDFISAAEHLIDKKYTSKKKIAIQGGSNGGLLVGAVELQRPDLFAAALPAVGVMDMIRFREFTIGWAWQSDYGNVDNKDEFDVLYSYSPLHNIKAGVEYPPTLITTADHDDRVFPAHSFKFAAAMQAAQTGTNPILIRIETRAGHGAGKPTSKRIAEAADQIAFIAKYLGIKL